MTTVIAITGRVGAGKDSAADVLVAHAGFCKLAFADTLRAEIAIAFDLTQRPAILTDRATKEAPHDALALRNCKSFCFIGAVAMATHATVNSEWLDAPRSPRQILQWWGTEYRRAEDPAYWVNTMAQRIRVRAEGGISRFVVTDCRFPNELAMLAAKFGAKLWAIERAGLPDVEGGHASAAGLGQVVPAAVLRNDGTPDALRSEVLRRWWSMDSGIHADQLRIEVAPCQ